MNWTETASLTALGMAFAFILSFCRLLEQSRCTTIKCCGASCDRDVYSAKDIEMLERKDKQENKKEKDDTDNNV